MDAQNPRTAAVAIVHRPTINKPLLRERGQRDRLVYRVPFTNHYRVHVNGGSKITGVVVLATHSDISIALNQNPLNTQRLSYIS
jgi:hypothetical protein